MKRFIWFNLILILVLLAGCTRSTQSPDITATSGLPAPQVETTPSPDAIAALDAYLATLKSEDYGKLYGLTSAESQSKITLEDFTKRYTDAFNEMGMQGLDYSILSELTQPNSSEVSYRINYKTAMIGDLSRDIVGHFILENGGWKLQWDETLILPEFAGGRKLVMQYKIPTRGDIYDRNGKAIASKDTVYAIGLVPGEINPDTENSLLGLLSRFTGKTAEQIANSYAYAGPDWYIPVGEASAEELKGYVGVLSAFTGVRLTEYSSRYYQHGGAPHTTGYVIGISEEELPKYKRLGYSGSERVGNSGVEESMESILAGKHGGTLSLAESDGTILQPLASVEPVPANSLTMTIDRQLEINTQDALKGFTGAIVVLERDTGRVLAIASSPEFDPNLFDPNNPNINYTTDITPGAYYNRATQGEYPLGSVFKIITMAAGLETGVFTPDSKYMCEYTWTELNDIVRHDWTWQHCEDEKLTSEDGSCTTRPSGELTLKQGLMRSCNPWFWHIGLTLYNTGRTTAVSDMARAFGLGAPTGIEISESPGNIVDPSEPVQAVNSAIGQDPVLVTPLQVARFVAAVGNGGTLYRPQIVEKITDVNNQVTQSFKPEAQGTLPIKQENLQAIQDAMRDVVDNPRGTAYYRLGTVSYRIFGKTGTAETSTGVPHAWFAGYTDLNNPNIPDIAVAVLLEFQGEGSQWAAPVFKRVVDSYVYGKPQSIYPWESSFGVWRTPEPDPAATETPVP